MGAILRENDGEAENDEDNKNNDKSDLGGD